MLGMSMARSTRSGTLVGPGIWRKCLPVCTVMWRLSRYCLGFARLEYHYSAGLSPAEINVLSHWNRPPLHGNTCPCARRTALNDALKSRLARRASESLYVPRRDTVGF